MIRIVIADDHPIVRNGIKQILSDLPQDISVEEAGSSNELLKKIKDMVFDIIILDIKMPGRSGLDILTDLKRLKCTTPVLILSMHSEEQFAIRAIRDGASGYVTKDTATTELTRAVEKILSGGKYITASIAEKMADNLQNGTDKVLHNSLSNRESEVLQKIAEGKSAKTIAEELFISEKTVSTYRSRILGKMRMTNSAQLIKYAIENGLVN